MKRKIIQYDSKKQKLTITGSKPQSINQRELNVLNENRISGVLRLTAVRETPPVCLTAAAADLTPLHEFLRTVIVSKQLFCHIIRSLLNTLQQADALKFSRNLFAWSTEHVFVRRSTMELLLLYVPLQPCELPGAFVDLLHEIMSGASFDPTEDVSYLRPFLEIIQNKSQFSLYLLNEYLRFLEGGPRTAPVRRPVLTDPRTGQSTAIDKSPFRIGKRLDVSDFRIENSAVSRTHAEILTENGDLR